MESALHHQTPEGGGGGRGSELVLTRRVAFIENIDAATSASNG